MKLWNEFIRRIFNDSELNMLARMDGRMNWELRVRNRLCCFWSPCPRMKPRKTSRGSRPLGPIIEPGISWIRAVLRGSASVICGIFVERSTIRSWVIMSPAVSQHSVWLQTGRPRFDPRQRQSIFLLASLVNCYYHSFIHSLTHSSVTVCSPCKDLGRFTRNVS
jgi:hypothetical protein